MISQNQIRSAIQSTIIEYKKSWKVLRSLKEHQQIDPDALMDFQYNLAHAMYKLEKLLIEINDERKQVISRKNKLTLNWFENRLRILAKYTKILNNVLHIGRGIGDAFAWFFFHKERDILNEHLKHEAIKHLPVGIGGIGELEFIKNTKKLANAFIIYHGTTTFLRHGDISLIDIPSFKLSAIGEIKTEKVGKDKINVSVFMLGKNQEFATTVKKQASNKQPVAPKLPLKTETQLRKQLKAISEAISSEQNLSMENSRSKSKSSISQLAELSDKYQENSFLSQKISDGLLALSFRPRIRNLTNYYMKESSQIPNQLDKAEFEDIVCPHTNNNFAIINTLLYSKNGETVLMPGMMPLFWWPINNDFIEDVYFQHTIVATIYNPAFFFARLQDLNYEVKVHDFQKEIEIRKSLKEAQIELKNIKYLFSLIQNCFIDESVILDIILKQTEKYSTKDFNKNMQIAMDIRQSFGL